MARVILGKYIGMEVPAKLTKKEKQDYIVREIVENSAVEVSEEEISDRAKRMVEEYAIRLSRLGLSIEQYYEVAHTDEKTLLNKMKEPAKYSLKRQMVLETIARKEGLTVRCPAGKENSKAAMKGSEEKHLQSETAVKKAMDLVAAHAVEVP